MTRKWYSAFNRKKSISLYIVLFQVVLIFLIIPFIFTYFKDSLLILKILIYLVLIFLISFLFFIPFLNAFLYSNRISLFNSVISLIDLSESDTELTTFLYFHFSFVAFICLFFSYIILLRYIYLISRAFENRNKNK